MANAAQQFLEMVVGLGEARQRNLPTGFAIAQGYCYTCHRNGEHFIYQHSMTDRVLETDECVACGKREFQTRAAKSLTNH